MFAHATPEMLRCSQTLHQLATSVQQARRFFHLSFPMNGVLLPEERCIFPFSLRSPHAGTFQQVYELLTVPQSATRILIDLHGIVSPAFPSVDALAFPLEEVLTKKIAHDAQRELVQSIARSTYPFAASAGTPSKKRPCWAPFWCVLHLSRWSSAGEWPSPSSSAFFFTGSPFSGFPSHTGGGGGIECCQFAHHGRETREG